MIPAIPTTPAAMAPFDLDAPPVAAADALAEVLAAELEAIVDVLVADTEALDVVEEGVGDDVSDATTEDREDVIEARTLARPNVGL